MKGVIMIPAKGGNSIFFKSVAECRGKMKLSNTRFYNALEDGSPVFCVNENGETQGYFIDEEI